MTPHLHVQVALHEAVVEDRLLRVRGQTWLGECDGAAVSFLGAIVGVRAADGALWIRGERLDPDHPWERQLGAVSVRLEAVLPDRLPRDWTWVPDPRLLVATVALLLAGAFVDTLKAGPSAHGADRAEPLHEVGRAPEDAPVREGYREAPQVRERSADWPPTATFQLDPEVRCPPTNPRE